ncbi:MAG: rod shape-determining protein MreC [Deltaproteobacteria bacterium]|nr:rod shape-determining protein MreC [Deltaproteobacteria bacterium]MBW2071742.1 rod shape-determining protein MreC [Deltaproteobacteria bacterium]
MAVTRQLRKIFFPILIFFIALSLLSVRLHSKEGLSFVERLVVTVTAPVQKAVHVVVSTIGDVWRGYFYLVGLQKDNEELRQRLAELKAELNRLQEAELANQRLRALLDFKQAMTTPLLPAEVVASDPSGWFQTVLIDKGRVDGVVRDLAVVNAAGLVGRVIGASRHHAKVLLIIDRNSAVDSLVQRTRSRGVLVGTGDGSCRLKYVRRNEEVRLGDEIISSGMDGVFPKGILLGRVDRVVRGDAGLFQEVEVIPTVDFSRLEEVLVVLQPPPEDLQQIRGPQEGE